MPSRNHRHPGYNNKSRFSVDEEKPNRVGILTTIEKVGGENKKEKRIFRSANTLLQARVWWLMIVMVATT